MDRNKGSAESPEVRCRLVAQEFASKDKEGLFAATPPLAAARGLLSILASQGRGGPGSWKAMLLDVKKAFHMATSKEGSISNSHRKTLEELVGKWWVC